MLRFIIILTAIIAFAVDTSAQVLLENSIDESCQKSVHNTISITIEEDQLDNFNLTTGVDQTLIFRPTSGVFETGKGNVEFLREDYTEPDVDISVQITASQITVTLHANTDTHLSWPNSLVLFNIGVVIGNISTSLEVVDIEYVSGTAPVNGLTPGTAIKSTNFHPLPVVTPGGTVATCSSVAFTPTANMSANFTWSADYNPNVAGAGSGEGDITDNLTNHSNVEEIVTYRVHAEETEFNCVSEEELVLVTVFPAPNITANPPLVSGSICVDTEATFTATNTAGGSFSWGASGTYDGSGGGGGPTDESWTVKWIEGTEAAVSVEYTNSFGCFGSGGLNININNNEVPEPSGNGEATGCRTYIGNYYLPQHIVLTDPPTVTEFSWVTSANADFDGESTTPKTDIYITDELINLTLSDQEIVYTVTPRSACGTGTPFTVTLTVHPEPITVPEAITLSCAESEIGFPLDQLITNGITSSFRWQAIENDNVEGLSTMYPTYTSTITDIPVLADGAGTLEEVVYIVTPTDAGGNFCDGKSLEVTVRVPALPKAETFEVDICGNTAVGVNLQGHITNAVTSTFEWYVSENLPAVTGESTSSQNASTITDILTTLGTVQETVSYTVIPTSDNGCLGSVFNVDVRVKGIPEADNTSETFCSGIAQNFNISTYYESGDGLPASSFSWLAANNANVTGETTTPQATTSITEIITNATATGQNVVYAITPTGPDGCAGIPFTYTLTSNPSPGTVVTNPSPTISSTGSTNIALSSLVPGSTFSYSVSAPPEISGASDGAGTSIAQQLTNATTLQQIVTYTITASANGCSGSQAIATITVRGDPTMNQNDSLALVALYNALGGTNWANQTHWLSGPAETWHGVDVSGERLISLALPGNNLTGELPVEFFNAPFLTLLDLGNNGITGSLPAEVSSLTELQVLDVQNNELSGDLPNSLFFLIDLTQLYLRGNDFTGSIPAIVNNLASLQTLQAEGLPMDGPIPAEVFEITSLVNLGLSGKLNGPVPSTIGNLASLFTFNCDSCAITALPDEITGLSSLASIRLHNNALESLPDLSSLPLNYLDVGKNTLTFESLEPYVSVSTFVYVAQNTIGTAETILLQTTIPHTFTSGIGGSANQYVWKKNDVVIPSQNESGYTIASPVFEDEGVYHAEATSSLVSGLTLKTAPITVRVSSLKRDSLTLVEVYNSTNGAAWTGISGWPGTTQPLSAWTGVTISSNRITALDLGNRGLTGSLPADFSDLRSLQTANLSGNKLTSIPSIHAMNALTNLNIASNNIPFGPLEENSGDLGKITYAPQNEIGIVSKDSISAETSVELSAATSGINNVYQWKRNNVNVTNGTSGTLNISSLNRETMGDYFCEITNTVVPGLTLQTALKTVLATAELSGKIKINETDPATKGTVTLLRVTASGPFEKTKIRAIESDGTYSFPKVVLGDYQIMSFADTIEHERAIPTYYETTTLWEEADTLFVNNTLTDLDIITVFKPAPPSGRGVVSGVVEEEDGTSGGRTKLPKPVRTAGVSARRVQSTGRGQEEILTLVAYTFTNDQGEFSLTNLDAGNYRLNIQYPGFPMDVTSFINFTIGTGLQSEVKVEALADKGVINVRQLIITGIWSKEAYRADVFPNPARSVIHMEFDTVCPYRDIGIFDISGKNVRQIDGSDNTVDVNVDDLPKGLYLINVSEKDSLVKSLHVIIE